MEDHVEEQVDDYVEEQVEEDVPGVSDSEGGGDQLVDDPAMELGFQFGIVSPSVDLPVGFFGDQDQLDEDPAKFKCVPCDMIFRDTSNLKRHVKLYHEQREQAVQCPRTWCDEKFSTLADMNRHKGTCMLVCPYDGCPKLFRKENRFEAHQRAHQIMTRRMMD